MGRMRRESGVEDGHVRGNRAGWDKGGHNAVEDLFENGSVSFDI